MNSYAISIQSSQFRPTTSQPGPTGLYQDTTSVPSNHAQATPSPSHAQVPLRPHTVEELEERVKQALYDDARSLKTWFLIGKNASRGAKTFYKQGELELDYEEYAKAATIVLEKIPAHPDYRVFLSNVQRHNMRMVSYFSPLGPHTCASVGMCTSRMNALTNALSVFLHDMSCNACDSHLVIPSQASILFCLILSPLTPTWRQTNVSASWYRCLLLSIYRQRIGATHGAPIVVISYCLMSPTLIRVWLSVFVLTDIQNGQEDS